MSSLSEALERSLEAVKRDLESPVEKSLRAEVATLNGKLEALHKAYDRKCRDIDGLYEQIRYQDPHHRHQTFPHGAITNPRVQVDRVSYDTRQVITARVMFDDMALRGFSEEAVRDQIAGMLAGQLASHLYGSHIAPERPERAQDPSSEHKVTQSSGTPLPGYPLQDTRPPLVGPLKRDHIASPTSISTRRR